MAREIVDIRPVEMNGTELQTVRGLDITKSLAKTAQKTMRRNRVPLGYTYGIREVTAQLTVLYLKGDMEVDWNQYLMSGDTFFLTYELGPGGKRRTLVDCVVNEISEPSSVDADGTVTISITALNDKAED